jgi:hypothetical protein
MDGPRFAGAVAEQRQLRDASDETPGSSFQPCLPQRLARSTIRVVVTQPVSRMSVSSEVCLRHPTRWGTGRARWARWIHLGAAPHGYLSGHPPIGRTGCVPHADSRRPTGGMSGCRLTASRGVAGSSDGSRSDGRRDRSGGRSKLSGTLCGKVVVDPAGTEGTTQCRFQMPSHASIDSPPTA